MLREREDYYHENNKDTMKNMFFIGNKNIFELDNYDKEEVERQRKVGAAAFNKKNGSNRKDKKAKTKKKSYDLNYSIKRKLTKQEVKENNDNQVQLVKNELNHDVINSEKQNDYNLMKISSQKCHKCYISHTPYVKFCRWLEEKKKRSILEPKPRLKPRWNMMRFTDHVLLLKRIIQLQKVENQKIKEHKKDKVLSDKFDCCKKKN